MKMNIIHKVAAVVMTVCTFVLSSCGSENPAEPKVSVRSQNVGHEAGSMFVSVECEGDWKLNLEYYGADQDWASISLAEGSGNKNNIVLSYKANETDEYRIVWLVIISGSMSSECSVTQAAYSETPEPGPEPEKPVTDVLKADWLELPAMSKDSGLEYYSHSFEMNGKAYRNFSFGWSQKDLVALWMAYPLCKFYTNKNVSRSDAWNYDPLLGMEKSPAPFGGYGEELARGHQVPSADRLCCYEANSQTFYGTNMTPQRNDHNEGTWSNLESAVRNWANTSDTTYVVTGCLVEGSKRITKDSDGKNITVPVAYYKAVLRYHKSSTISQWAAAAFYTEHKDYNDRNLKNFSMSIDDLEEITGLDFFANLPAKLGESKAAELEAQDPKTSNIWW